jgi:hypothetical protein
VSDDSGRVGFELDFLEFSIALLGVLAGLLAGVWAFEDFDFAAAVIVDALDPPIVGVLAILKNMGHTWRSRHS